jgi:5-(carboxyamino)imidazole ribonucleotide synthase
MVNSEADLKQAVETIGLPAILKTATEGYDGKGQFLPTTIVGLLWSVDLCVSEMSSFVFISLSLSLDIFCADPLSIP